MKNVCHSKGIWGFLVLCLVASSLLYSERVQAMTIEDPPEEWGHPIGQCFGQGNGDDYTIKYRTGDRETSHSIQVEAIINKKGKFSYKKILDRVRIRHPSRKPNVEKKIPVVNKWPTNGDWVIITSWYVYNGQEHKNGVVVCKTKDTSLRTPPSPTTMGSEVSETEPKPEVDEPKPEVDEPKSEINVPKSEVMEVIIVRFGDTLSHLAQEHGTTVQDLREANGLTNANFIVVGQSLVIPPRE